MFGNRRRRATSNPPLNGSTVHPSAATAAAQAFLGSRTSNASLSSAAAAAALRSRPTTPIDVSAVQTKRTMRRSNSQSSMGSGISGRRGSTPNLERRLSNGSMSERTLRDQSPNRVSPVIPEDAPPVPAIPQNIKPSIPAKSHRRAASLDAPAMRISSPTPNLANGRGSSLQPTAGSQPEKRNRNSSLSSVQEWIGVERPGSRGSVNFSYPTNCERTMSPVRIRRLTSPSPSRRQEPVKIQNSAGLIYDPNTRSFLPAAEIYAIEESLRLAAEGPPKRKKNAVPKGAKAGSHLADGTSNGRPKGTAVDAMEAITTQPAQPTLPTQSIQPTPATLANISEPEVTQPDIQQPAIVIPKRKKKKSPTVPTYEDPDSSMSNTSDYDTDTSDRMFNTRAAALLVKKPSVVQEERELEEQEATKTSATQSHQRALSKFETGSNTSLSTGSTSPTPQPRSIPKQKTNDRGKNLASAAFAQERQGTRAVSQPLPSYLDNIPNALGDAYLGGNKEPVREGRGQSVSPVRTTRFSAAPENLSNLTVIHQPPARSVSPRKSALKHSPSPRGPSPNGQVPGEWNNHYATSETSDSSAIPDEITGAKKKKNARVSFDDSNIVIVGSAAGNLSTNSPIAPSPQAQKRGWFSHIGRGNKRDTSVIDDDEVMKPRPALPSFGSVREKKVRDVEDQSLVTPSEPVEQSTPSPPLVTSISGETLENPPGISKDHAVGAIIAYDHTTKNAANISKSREPLPPEVTTVEGTGYNSDSGSSDYETPTEPGIGRKPSVKRGLPGVDVEEYRALASPTSGRDTPEDANGNVPQINLQQPTPTLDDANKQREWPQLPGGFPGSSESIDAIYQDGSHIIDHKTADTTPSAVGISEPLPKGTEPDTPIPGETLTNNLNQHNQSVLEEIEEDSDSASVYDDAPEELLEPEGDGFLSLNAVADSPISENTPGLALSTPPESPTIAMAKDRAYRRSLVRQNSEPDPDEGWGKAQQYWKSLTEEKRNALEAEARGGLDVESSEDEVEVPAPQAKTKPKKKTVVLQEPPSDQLRDTAENTARNTAANTGVNPQRNYAIQPGTKAASNGITPPMRSSMRSPPPNTANEPHMRKSMRNGGDVNGGTMRGSMRSSMRDGPENVAPPPKPRGSLQKKYRPLSHHDTQQAPSPQAHNQTVSAETLTASSAAIKQAQAMMAPNKLTRQNSAGSDSSFTRAKGVRNGSMRQSMRSSSGQQPLNRPSSMDEPKSSRFSMRSLSPSGSTFRKPFNAGGAPPVSIMQSSMRNRPDSASSSLRENRRSQSSTSGFLGFGKTPKSQAKASKPTKSSRFADSSDEDEDHPTLFRSRFVDSSDEEDNIAPVQNRGKRMSTLRPIPKMSGVADGDSSDLPDSDDEEPPPRALGKIAPPILPATNDHAAVTGGTLRSTGSGRDLSSSFTERPTQKRRGSFMSILRRKKDPESRIRKSDSESLARRDTHLERNPAELAHVRRGSGSRPTSPKLQKRNGPKRSGSGSGTWPLRLPPAVLDDGDDKRPATADDAAALNGNGANGASARPEIGGRRTTATGVSSVDIVGGVGPKKKKRFPKLRKALGLND